MTSVTGLCTATFAFEVGQDIKLGECERKLGDTERQTVRSRLRLPLYFNTAPRRFASSRNRSRQSYWGTG